MTLARYLGGRLLQLIPVLFLVSVGVFLLVQIIPGDPVAIMLGVSPDSAGFNKDQYDTLRHELGFDQPLYERYLSWAGRIVHGDFGVSLKSRRPVADLLFERYPATIYLTIVALLVSLAIAVPIGVFAAVRQNTIFDYLGMTFSLVGLAMPGFWLALLLILLFSLKLGWFPAIGYAAPLAQPVDFLKHVAMPAIVLGTSFAAQLARYLRAETIEQLHQDYVRSARAWGLPPRTVIFKHAVRNSLISVVTVAGLHTARLLGGTPIVESIFGWPGVASLLLDSIYARYYPTVQASVLILALTYVTLNLVVDVVYHLLDPRIRLA